MYSCCLYFCTKTIDYDNGIKRRKTSATADNEASFCNLYNIVKCSTSIHMVSSATICGFR